MCLFWLEKGQIPPYHKSQQFSFPNSILQGLFKELV